MFEEQLKVPSGNQGNVNLLLALTTAIIGTGTVVVWQTWCQSVREDVNDFY